MDQVDHPLPSEGAEVALNAITDKVLATLKEINLEEVVETPFGSMPGGQFIMVPITDMIIHTWDLAKATGHHTTLDAGLSEIGFNVVSVVAPLGGERGAFGPEVSVDDPASFPRPNAKYVWTPTLTFNNLRERKSPVLYLEGRGFFS